MVDWDSPTWGARATCVHIGLECGDDRHGASEQLAEETRG